MTSLLRKHHRVACCGGHACPKCHKCADWYWDASNHTDCEPTYRAYAKHLGPLVGPLYRWHRRPDATCGYHSYPHYVHYVASHGGDFCSHAFKCQQHSNISHTHFYPWSTDMPL